ncbi:MAG: nitroreductase family protein [Anaerolineae bacterium]|nr:nitroreductase family protein [Anaerolineae bacterium]
MSNPVIDCLLAHRSIRKFTLEPIDETTLELILRAGVRAASAGNMQQYSFIVVDDPALIKQLTRFDVPLVVVSVVDQFRTKRWLEVNDGPFYNDQLANVFVPFWDATIALQNVVVAAESLGLGTVYIGGVLGMNLQAILDVPEYIFPAGMVCIGYPDEDPPLRPRLPLEAVVHRNGYQRPTDDEVRAHHREKDAAWFDLSDERRAELEARGIHNFAQLRTLGNYTPEFVAGRSADILANLKRAGFRWPEENES